LEKKINKIRPCLNCNGNEIYMNKDGVSGGGFAADYLPGLGGFIYHAKLHPAICRDYALVRF
jgi:hypothetical protein